MRRAGCTQKRWAGGLLLGVLGQLLLASSGVAADASAAIQSGADWLIKQQDTDGGWHSTSYGQMRCGVGNTALALYALAQLPATTRAPYRPQFERGCEFLMSILSAEGAVRNPDGEADYPTYATALLLTAIQRFDIDRWPAERRRMRAYLVTAQQTAERGWTAGHPEFGGWNAMEISAGTPDRPGGTSISIMRFVVEALVDTGTLSDESRRGVFAYLARCQNLDSGQRDGGFCFNPIADHPLNKAGWRTESGSTVANSYGSATADGLWLLLACGAKPEDQRVVAANQWLSQHRQLQRVPGIEDRDHAALAARDGLRFYFAAALAALAPRLVAATTIIDCDKLSAQLCQAQRADGSWINPDNSMREDDPLIATAWALVALGKLLAHP